MFNKIRIVLVNTTHPGNIGGAARALKNMGLARLVLVAPKEWPADRALWRAASAVDVLDRIQVVDTLEEAVADCELVVGTSARERRIPWPLVTPRECGDKVWGEVASEHGHEAAIVFGREDRGLTNDELQRCNYHVHIPSNPDYTSLNLAAAVQVVTYEVRMSALNAENGAPLHFDDWDMPRAKQADLEHYYEHLQTTLEDLSFITPDNPRQTLTRLRRLYNRIRLDKMELSILRGVLTTVQNFAYHSKNKIKDLEAKVKALEDKTQ